MKSIRGWLDNLPIDPKNATVDFESHGHSGRAGIGGGGMPGRIPHGYRPSDGLVPSSFLPSAIDRPRPKTDSHLLQFCTQDVRGTTLRVLATWRKTDGRTHGARTLSGPLDLRTLRFARPTSDDLT